jgi:LPS O-antigen subunit length determinant protein (WzzB/FepE family)
VLVTATLSTAFAPAVAALQLFVERFSSAQKAVMQEEKDAAERKQRLARAEAKKAAAEAAKKVRLVCLVC